MIRIQYTSIENPLLKDIPVHVYQTYPTDSIERLYVELYKLLHMEYIKALVDEL